MKALSLLIVTAVVLISGCVVKEEGYHHRDRVYVEPVERVEVERPYHHHHDVIEEKVEVR